MQMTTLYREIMVEILTHLKNDIPVSFTYPQFIYSHMIDEKYRQSTMYRKLELKLDYLQTQIKITNVAEKIASQIRKSDFPWEIQFSLGKKENKYKLEICHIVSQHDTYNDRFDIKRNFPDKEENFSLILTKKGIQRERITEKGDIETVFLTQREATNFIQWLFLGCPWRSET